MFFPYSTHSAFTPPQIISRSSTEGSMFLSGMIVGSVMMYGFLVLLKNLFRIPHHKCENSDFHRMSIEEFIQKCANDDNISDDSSSMTSEVMIDSLTDNSYSRKRRRPIKNKRPRRENPYSETSETCSMCLQPIVLKHVVNGPDKGKAYLSCRTPKCDSFRFHSPPSKSYRHIFFDNTEDNVVDNYSEENEVSYFKALPSDDSKIMKDFMKNTQHYENYESDESLVADPFRVVCIHGRHRLWRELDEDEKRDYLDWEMTQWRNSYSKQSHRVNS